MRIWEIPHSTNVERVCLALAHKGQSIEHVLVPDEDRSEIVRISGQELVPVVQTDNDEILVDSPAILRWIEEQWPDPPLWPRAPRARAEAEIFVDWFNHVWKRPPNLYYVEEQKAVPDRERMERWSRRMRESLDRFEALLDGRQYLQGDEFGIADVVAFPFLKYAALGLPEGDEHAFHVMLVEHMPTDGRYPRLREWARRCDARPRA